ncbi:transmembrane anchor protein [Marinomonas primoryensis]
MPAEYAIDPTGIGRLLGLNQMGEIKEQLADEAIADAAAQLTTMSSPAKERSREPLNQIESAVVKPALAAPIQPIWEDEVRVVLSPGEGTEFKLTMNMGETANFHWVTDGGSVNFDTHGDGGGKSISYEKGRGVTEDEGELTAAFTGNHGWFFRNRNNNDITLVLRTRGNYRELKRAI